MGKEYLDESLFQKMGINVIYDDFQHPKYRQQFESFVPNLSIIDLLSNIGSDSKKFVKEEFLNYN